MKKQNTMDVFCYIKRIYLNEVAELINRVDSRPVQTWCKKYNVQIYDDSTGKFVYQNDFDLAYDLPLIKQLKEKHGDKWEDVYDLYKNDNLHKLIELDVKFKSIGTSYSPKSQQASNFKLKQLKTNNNN